MAGGSFLSRLRSGAIRSVEELKAEFKAAAKESHPDTGGAPSAEDFLRLRRDYEAALRELAQAAPPSRASGYAGDAADATPGVADPCRTDPFSALEALLKRDFPKEPKHAQELRRYAVARLRARAALSAAEERGGSLFDAFEAALLELRRRDPALFRRCRLLLSDLVAAQREESAERLAALRMELRRLAAPPSLGRPEGGAGQSGGGRVEEAVADFLKLLAYWKSNKA